MNGVFCFNLHLNAVFSKKNVFIFAKLNILSIFTTEFDVRLLDEFILNGMY